MQDSVVNLGRRVGDLSYPVVQPFPRLHDGAFTFYWTPNCQQQLKGMDSNRGCPIFLGRACMV
eukprot:3535226-Amphidinium_carterae.1